MSGIYLVVWDDVENDNSAVLRMTKGGPPHVTVAYTGKLLERNVLLDIAGHCLSQWALKDITLVNAYVNSFQTSKGVMRHDVLMALSDQDAAEIRDMRDSFLVSYANAHQFVMRVPHVTHSINATKQEADVTAAMLNELHLPCKVKVIGVTI